MNSRDAAYRNADKIDQRINNMLEHDPPSAANWQHWLLFLRTVRTTLDIVDLELERYKQR